jgi:hypothetical protein
MSSDNTNQNADSAKAKDIIGLKDPAEMTAEEMRIERAKLELERSRLELAKLRRDNIKAKEQEEELQKRIEQQGRNYEELRKRDLAIQAICTHRKGGMDTASLSKQGNDSNYSVIKHTGTFGGTTVLCSRCCKLWLPADPEFGGKPTPGYAEAVRFPTDNQPSSSVVFQSVAA